MKNLSLISSIIILMLLSACEPQRQDIFYGEEECAHCSMLISEPQFAGQLLTETGRHFNFDAIECLVAFKEGGTVAEEDIHSMWVPGFDDETWLPAREAYFLRSPNLPSPMSLNLSAFQHLSQVEEYQRSYTGNIYSWSEIQNLVRQEWFNKQ